MTPKVKKLRSTNAIQIKDLSVAYHNKPVLWRVNLCVPEGALMAVVGPNGAGKSTLIKSLLGIVKPLQGKVEIYDEPYRKNRRLLAYVPQRSSVDWDFPTTVLDVVLMGTYGRLGWIKRPGKAQKVAALEALAQVGMESFSHRQISQLSGGQQQRVFIARALVQDAEIYCLDEPFQGVDATSEKAIVNLLHSLKAQNKTVLVVHHDLNTVSEYFDWLTLLNVETIASGRMSEVFTEENINQTYGIKAMPSI